ncbi:MAG: response regulator [Kordiimonadaceae bacterium]|nr:response regulator [Kordiimonadaceae bacterium]
MHKWLWGIALSGPTVLIADDSLVARSMICRIIEAECNIIAIADNGLLALEYALHFTPDIALLDISMPNLNGFNVAEKITILKLPIKIIFISGFEETVYIRKARAVGASAYVAKPCIASDLLEAMNEAMHGRWFVSPYLEKLKK